MSNIAILFQLNELSWSQGSDQIFCAVTADTLGGMCAFSFSNDDLRESLVSLAHCSSAYFLQCDADKGHMALGSQDFCVTLWDTCEAVCTHTLPIGYVYGYGYGYRLCSDPSYGEYGDMVTWVVMLMHTDCSCVCRADIRGLSFSKEGEYLAIISEDPSVLIVSTRSS
ncbi:hypothetical protein EON63_12390 [archaeon]|nr:MAG: hypothetical protein EON63_12390 [archaeon]